MEHEGIQPGHKSTLSSATEAEARQSPFDVHPPEVALSFTRANRMESNPV